MNGIFSFPFVALLQNIYCTQLAFSSILRMPFTFPPVAYMAPQLQPHQGTENSANDSLCPQNCAQAVPVPSQAPSQAPSQRQDVLAMATSYRVSSLWDMEADSIFLSTDNSSIQQILQLGWYDNVDSLRHNLRCQVELLDPLLDSLRPIMVEGGQQATTQLTDHRKVEEILTLVIPPPPSALWRETWDWNPKKSVDEIDVLRIAAYIDEESCSYFKEVPFIHWLKCSIGYQIETLRRLLSKHFRLSCSIYAYLLMHPNELDKYIAVEKVISPCPNYI